MGVSLRQWLDRSYTGIREDGKRGLLHSGYTLALGGWYTVSSRRPLARNIYEDSWNLLVVLDACRVDALEKVQEEYDFIEHINERWSVGSHSREWLAKTFTEEWCEDIASTTMVTGNGHAHTVFVEGTLPPKETVPFAHLRWDTVDRDAFNRLEMLWETHHEEGFGVRPRILTERGIANGREHAGDRIILHYMQPHIPYIAEALREERPPTDIESRGWKVLEAGGGDRDRVWDLYIENLRLVLDEVALVLENFDAENVVITADHGNAFGEWGIYGHPEGFPHPVVKKVPWVETKAKDERTYEPTVEFEASDGIGQNVEAHLADLGYL